MISWIIKTEFCVMCQSRRLRQITQTWGFDNTWYHGKTEFNNCFIIHLLNNRFSKMAVLCSIFAKPCRFKSTHFARNTLFTSANSGSCIMSVPLILSWNACWVQIVKKSWNFSNTGSHHFFSSFRIKPFQNIHQRDFIIMMWLVEVLFLQVFIKDFNACLRCSFCVFEIFLLN